MVRKEIKDNILRTLESAKKDGINYYTKGQLYSELDDYDKYQGRPPRPELTRALHQLEKEGKIHRQFMSFNKFNRPRQFTAYKLGKKVAKM